VIAAWHKDTSSEKNRNHLHYGGRGMLRGEITYNNFNVVIRHPKGPDGTTYSPSYEATRLKLSYIFAF